ncbi:MAG: UDP-N-acetylmuramoyl-L-alanyl-D-glutamate--2,6-diaminopimelate ligase [Porticoccaceae bacterium]
MAALESRAGSPLLGTLLPGVELAAKFASLPVGGLHLDSRAVRPGELFVAVPGGQSDGRAFIPQAAAAGAVAALAEAAGLTAAATAIPVIPVRGLAAKLSEIAGRFYGDPSLAIAVTGVTGTNGKTTVSQLLARLFAELGVCSGVVGTLGWGLVGGERQANSATAMTTPDAIRTQEILAGLRDQGARWVVMEVSSHSLSQHRVAAVRFNTAVFTNLSRDHLDYHGDMGHYRDAKARLFQQPGLRCAIINGDDPIAERLIAGFPPGLVVYRYSVSDAATDIYLRNLRLSRSGFDGELVSPWGLGEVRSPLLGRFNVSNVLATIAAACAQGFPLADVLAVTPALSPVRGRMEIVEPGAAPVVVVDYAHTPAALEQVLLTLRESSSGKLWCVFGCGGDRDRGKRPQMGEIAGRLADHVVITSDNSRSETAAAIIADILAGVGGAPARARVETIVDRRAAICHAIRLAAADDTVLIAGKGHEDYQVIAGRRALFSDVAEAGQALRARGERLL